MKSLLTDRLQQARAPSSDGVEQKNSAKIISTARETFISGVVRLINHRDLGDTPC